MTRVGQNHIYTVYKRCFWQKSHHTYSHIRCKYTVLANPTYDPMLLLVTKKRTCHEVHNNSISSKATRENERLPCTSEPRAVSKRSVWVSSNLAEWQGRK